MQTQDECQIHMLTGRLEPAPAHAYFWHNKSMRRWIDRAVSIRCRGSGGRSPPASSQQCGMQRLVHIVLKVTTELEYGVSMTFTLWFLIAGGLLIFMALAGSVLRRLPLSTAMVYLAVGLGLGPLGLGLLDLDIVRDAAL